MNKVWLTGRVYRDPDFSTGPSRCAFIMSTPNDDGTRETHKVVVGGRLAALCALYIAKGNEVAVEGRLTHHAEGSVWVTEVAASSVEMILGRRRSDFNLVARQLDEVKQP